MYQFLNGATMVLSFVAALCFFKSATRTGDRLFYFFGAAFAALGADRLVLAWINIPEGNEPQVYVLRLIAFLLILIGIVDKNRSRRSS